MYCHGCIQGVCISTPQHQVAVDGFLQLVISCAAHVACISGSA